MNAVAHTPQAADTKPDGNLVFDHYALRAVVGLLALFLPGAVVIRAGSIPSSISAAYDSAARDLFVASLAIIGMLLLAYKGHKPRLPVEQVGAFWSRVGGFLNPLIRNFNRHYDLRVEGRRHEEDWVSSLGGAGAITAALVPASGLGWSPYIHYVGDALLFANVVYFCLVAFLRGVTKKLNIPYGVRSFLQAATTRPAADSKKVLRGRLYVVCGWIIMADLLVLVAAQIVSRILKINSDATFWTEAVAMGFFGVAWITACQFAWLRDPNEPAG